MDFDNIENVSVDRDKAIYVNTEIRSSTLEPEQPETEQEVNDEERYEQLRIERQLHDSKRAGQDGAVERIKCLFYINLALVIVLYVTVTVLIIVVVNVVPKEQDDEWSKDGGWSSWESWNTCSESCGGGIISRNRTCSNPAPEGVGKQCIGNYEQADLCNKEPCPGIDGGWSVWESWGSCSHSCGGGVRFRARSCTNPSPSLTGRICTGDFTDVSICNRKTCPEYNVAFMASEFNTTFRKYATLKFQYVHLNYGNAYNTITGVFTCNVPEVYHFVITLTKTYRDITAMYAYLNINFSNKLIMKYDPADDDSNEIGTSVLTAAGTFHLDLNDIVYVSGVPIFFDGSSLKSSFTGFLITPDQ